MVMEGRTWHKAAMNNGAKIVPEIKVGFVYLYQLYTTCYAEFKTIEEADAFRDFADKNLTYWDYDGVATIDTTNPAELEKWKRLGYIH